MQVTKICLLGVEVLEVDDVWEAIWTMFGEASTIVFVLKCRFLYLLKQTLWRT